MAKKNTANDLIKAVRRRASLPASPALFDDQDILDFLTEELINILTPITMNVREEFLVFNYDLETEIDKELYQIPADAIGTGLRDLVLLDSDSTEYSIPYLSLDQKADASYQGYGTSFSGRGGTVSYFFQGNNVGLYPKPRSVYSVRMKYFKRPNELVLEKDAGAVTSFNATQVVVNRVLPFAIGDTVEFNQARSPYTALGSAVITALPTPQTLEFAAVPEGLVVGDWASEEGTSPVVNLPMEAQSVLVQSAVMKVLNATGDELQTNQAGEIYGQLKERYIDVISPRSDGAVKKVVSSNNISNFAAGGYRGYGWLGR